MGKSFLLFIAFCVLKAMSQELSNWVRIDCGSQTSQYDQNGLLWQTDENFIKTGENKQIYPNSGVPMDQLKTLRVFTEQNKNCYTLPAPTMDRYFIRAMFHYGNYDGRSNPPTFDISFDGNEWVTVVTFMTDTAYHEVIYTSKGHNISVCLARTQDGQFPFISMLEVWSLPDKTYALMTKDIAWIKKYRYNYGATKTIYGYPTDKLNRIWVAMIPSGVDAVNASFSSLDYTTVDEPPESAIIDAVEALTPFSSIILPFTFQELTPLHQVLAYFTETEDNANVTRSFDLYVNQEFKFNITPEFQNCTEYMMNIQSASSLNVQLIPKIGTDLPPIISAIEIYTGINPLPTGTSQDDLDGLAVLINSFEQLEGWSGEPCLPSDTVWQWLSCTSINPPRVTSMNLSGYGLNGSLNDFSQLQALVTIDLSNNSLNGPIPDFLGKLPNLRLLDLRNNYFSGGIPESISNNKRLTYYINGNQNLQHQKGKNLGLIIGLVVGIVVGLILVILLVVLIYYMKRRQSTSNHEQAVAMSPTRTGGGTAPGQPQQDDVSMTVSTEHAIPMSNGQLLPSAPDITSANRKEHDHSNEQFVTTPNEDFKPNVNTGPANHSPMMQLDMDDQEELNELLRLHGSTGAQSRT